jgi:flagellar protein FliJ
MKRRGLKALIRLHRFELDEKRRQIAAAETAHDNVLKRESALEEELANEKIFATDLNNMQGFFEPYAQNLLHRHEGIREELKETQSNLDHIRDEAQEVFQEAKKYELTDEYLQRLEEVELNRREQIDTDELGINIHRAGQHEADEE